MNGIPFRTATGITITSPSPAAQVLMSTGISDVGDVPGVAGISECKPSTTLVGSLAVVIEH